MMTLMDRRTFLITLPGLIACNDEERTEIAIDGDEFLLNGRPTYEGRTFEEHKVQGLLLNSRMVQGVFDDANPETVDRWAYPDTGAWDPQRNTDEFVRAMPEWRRHGLLSFTVNLQGGSPQGYSKVQPWRSSAYREDGALKADYLLRLERILDEADRLGMAPILGYFYFGQDEHFASDEAVRRAVEETTRWLLTKGYRNVLVEIANECNNQKYEQPLIQEARIHELMEQAKAIVVAGRRVLVSASFNGGTIPPSNVVRAADYLLIHGNGVKDPARITEMVAETRAVPGYRTMPILFNEDDHFNFDQPENNMMSAIGSYASWGYFDPGESNYRDGYQCPPVAWGINTERKKAFFEKVQQVTGA